VRDRDPDPAAPPLSPAADADEEESEGRKLPLSDQSV